MNQAANNSGQHQQQRQTVSSQKIEGTRFGCSSWQNQQGENQQGGNQQWQGIGPEWPAGRPPWRLKGRHADWHGRRRFFFLRFFGFFLLMLLLVTGGMAMLAYHITNFMGGTHQTFGLVWLGGCGLALAFPLLALTIMARVFRSYALPLADVMTAADQVADGNLAVRLEERGSREFQHLANSFNRMTAELERTEQQRRNLTADIAHELRTPLHIIQGNLEGVLDGIYEPDAEHIANTLEETRLLARLIEDLRLLTLAESGELQLQLDEVDLQDLLTDVATSLSGQAEASGIALIVKPFDDTSPVIHGDLLRLDQVLSNLVTNALRHTPEGGRVTLSAYCQEKQVTIAVTDTGTGIPAADLPFVFDRFWKGDRARTHLTGTGSGLGLAIARQLVEAHGGEIIAASEVGKGTTFTIQLPL